MHNTVKKLLSYIEEKHSSQRQNLHRPALNSCVDTVRSMSRHMSWNGTLQCGPRHGAEETTDTIKVFSRKYCACPSSLVVLRH